MSKPRADRSPSGRLSTGAALLLATLACAPRAMTAEGELIDLERGMAGAQVVARMGRPPDEVRPLGPGVEDWVYMELELERTFVLHMKNDQLQWTKMIEQAGRRY